METSACHRQRFCNLQVGHEGPCAPSFWQSKRFAEIDTRVQAECAADEATQLSCGCYGACRCDYSAAEQRADEDADSFYDALREAEVES